MANGLGLQRILQGAQGTMNLMEQARTAPFRQQAMQQQVRAGELGIKAQEQAIDEELRNFQKGKRYDRMLEWMDLPVDQQDSFIDREIMDMQMSGEDTSGIAWFKGLPREQQMQVAQGVVSRVEQMAGGKGPAAPSAVREFQFFQNLSPQDKKTFLSIKRSSPAARIEETAEGTFIFDPATKERTPLTTGAQEIEAAAQEAGAKTTASEQAKVDVKRIADDPRKRIQAESLLSNIDNVVSTAEEAQEVSGMMTTGFGGLLKHVPMTDARSLANKLDTVRAALAFDRLGEMREASKTGGALGQVSNIELGLLESARAKLDQLTNEKDLDAQLEKVIGHYNTLKMSILARRYREIAELGKTPQEINDQMVAEFGLGTAMNIRGMYLEKESGLSPDEVRSKLKEEFGGGQ